MNNKGQSLVTFILIIPIMVFIIYMVYEIGRISLLNNRLKGIGYLATNYGIKLIDKETAKDEITNFVKKNDSSIDSVVVSIEDNKLYITLSKNIGNNILANELFRLRVSYIGYLENEKVTIVNG